MTNEEAIAYFKEHNETLVSVAKDENVYDYEKQVIEADCMRRNFEANEKAIQALEQQPSEDCISRKALKEMLTEEWTKYMSMELDMNLSFVLEKISELPSVTPKSENSWKEIKIKFECDDCISKQAVLDLTGKSDWFESSDDYNDFVCAVCNLPSVKPTRPKGVWLKRDYWSNGVGMGETYGYYYQCSECKNRVKGGNESCDAKFCSNCGAQMGGSK